MIPLSLYIHIPWCVRKCPYCDFNSHEQKSALPEQQYVSALLEDLDRELDLYYQRSLARPNQLESIFIGGGTPSLFSPEALNLMLRGIEQRIAFAPNMEVTLEANPGTAEAAKFKEYRDIGINRLSIGVQSFHDQFLQKLGRIHGRKEAIAAAEMAHDAGFKRFNLDLMFGLPGQTPQQAMEDLQTALDLEAPHLSWYQLTLEPNTAFYHNPPTLPEDDALWDIQQAGSRLLNDAGFNQYEISAWQRDGQPSQHNMNYWSFGDYLGIGAGAHGKLTLANQADGLDIIRRHKFRNPKDYLNTEKGYLAGQNSVPMEDRPLEFMMNALRLKSGVASELFLQRTGLELSSTESSIQKAISLGLIKEDNSVIAPTEKGFGYLNNLLEIFVGDQIVELK
ncbi:radical SAM family heme chaperone HemW [Pelagibaculum spongiae]|uniref:Heme chaperone HemW n=1 Tax=Pelagibaculum spongiae TaxID=2080658 RepID=A0A2V1H6Y0_9GAMM|nr:radical SAM family heme chaperone HemW [Pelagibaculum spongiae]PVZ72192.1 YggW family oxidoreductase [Pelagibaculum spongiae]